MSLSACASTLAPLLSPADLQTQAIGQSSADQRKAAVRLAFVTPRDGRTWAVDEDGDGYFIATIQVREHRAQVQINCASPTITVTYLNSVNLKYGRKSDGTVVIHRNFNKWMQNFLADVQQQLGIMLAAGAQPPG
jgi:hypothetical protein